MASDLNTASKCIFVNFKQSKDMDAKQSTYFEPPLRISDLAYAKLGTDLEVRSSP